MAMVSWSKEGLGVPVQATMLILRKGATEVWRVALAESTHIALNFTSTNHDKKMHILAHCLGQEIGGVQT